MKKIRYLLTALFAIMLLPAFAQESMNIDSLFNWRDPSIPGSTIHNNTYNEIWGYAHNGREYAIIGSTLGTHIFDVTDPASSHQVEFIEGAVSGPSIIHRDFHDYDDYLYMVSDEGNSTLQIADLRFLPDSAPVVYDSNALFPRSHNIFIDSTSARMYVCGGTMLFAIYSLADPTSPTLLLDCPTDVPFWSTIGYVHDTYVRGDTAYLNAGPNGFFIVDFSNISAPQMIGSLDSYIEQGYNHSGWLMQNKPYYAMADETHGKHVKILDVSDLSNLQVTDTFGSNVSQFSIPHNLIYRGDYLYMSYYFDGVYVFNCTDPAHPVTAGFYDTSTEIQQNGVYRGCWGIYPLLPSGHVLASDMQTGLWVLGVSQILKVDELKPKPELSFTLFPNPVSDVLQVNDLPFGTDFSVIDMMGNNVLQGRSSSPSIDVSSLAKGIYCLLLDEESVAKTRFVKL